MGEPHTDHNGDVVHGDKVARDKIERQVNTAGGTYVEHYHAYYGVDKAREHDLHKLYLRRLFGKPWAEVSLADMGAGDQPLNLCDVYVPLPVDLQLTVRVFQDRITTWWVGSEDWANLARKVEEGSTLSRNAESHGLREDDLQHIVDGIQRQITAEAEARRARQTEEERQRESARLAQEEPQAENTTITLNAEDVASLNDALVVLGAPGSGKSSFARHFALRMAGDLLRSFGDRCEFESATLKTLGHDGGVPVTPIYIELRDLAATEDAFPALPADKTRKPAPMPDDALWRYLLRSPNGLASDLHDLQGALQNMLVNGEALIVLDGLDEIEGASDPRRLDQIQAFVRRLRKDYRARVLVTSRPYAYNQKTEAGAQPWRLTGFGVASLIDLDDDAMQALARALFAPADPEHGQALAGQFMNEIGRVPASLKTNPLFLTMLAGLWWRRKDHASDGERLPRTEAELYRQSLEHLLTRWTTKPGNTQSVEQMLGLDVGQLRRVLQIVALETQQVSEPGEDTTEFVVERLLKAIRDVRRRVIADDTIDYLQTKAGVLLSPRPDHYRFAHRSFQEHLAACELLGDADGAPSIAGLAAHVRAQPALWRQVLLHAGDELVRRDAREALRDLIRLLIDPWLADRADAATRHPALLALETAERHGLLTKTRDRRDPHRADLEDLQELAPALMADLRLVARERASAGRCLSKLGDERPGVARVEDIEWRAVPAGPFQMGSAEADALAWDDEKPLHEQRTEAFRIMRFPVTNAQYRQFMDAGGYTAARFWTHADDYWLPGQGFKGRYDDAVRTGPALDPDEVDRFGLDNQPVVRISWYEMVAFARWLTEHLRAANQLTQHEEVRLPSEAEWEKACRGDPSTGSGDARVTPWDGPPDPERGNYADSDIGAPSAVGCFPGGVTPFGCEDMIGNVWEWTTTKWTSNYANYAEAEDNTIDRSDEARVLRGGSWSGILRSARCAFRYSNFPDYRSSTSVFVVVWRPRLPPRFCSDLCARSAPENFEKQHKEDHVSREPGQSPKARPVRPVREEMPIFARTHDLLSWLLPMTNHFPRAHRHTFTQRLLAAAFDLREHLETANLRRGAERLAQLQLAEEAMARLKAYIRLANSWHWLSLGQYQHAAAMLVEIGKLLGGWRKVTAT